MKFSPHWPRIRKRKNWHTGSTSFLVDLGMVGGKRVRNQFPTLAEAKTYAQQVRVAHQNEGIAGLAIPLEIRLEAARCSSKLAEVGSTLTEATDYFMRHHAALGSAPTVSIMVDRLVDGIKAAGRRERTWRSLKTNLGRFTRHFGQRHLSEITLDELTAYCCPPHLSPQSRLNRIRIVSQLSNFAIRNDWTDVNLAEKIVRPAKEQKEPGILTVEEVIRLLRHADRFGLLPYIALGLFAGIRVAELSRLDWRAVRLGEGEIVIGADIAKIRARRVLPMSETLADWLRPCARAQGPIVAVRKLLGFRGGRKTRCDIHSQAIT